MSRVKFHARKMKETTAGNKSIFNICVDKVWNHASS